MLLYPCTSFLVRAIYDAGKDKGSRVRAPPRARTGRMRVVKYIKHEIYYCCYRHLKIRLALLIIHTQYVLLICAAPKRFAAFTHVVEKKPRRARVGFSCCVPLCKITLKTTAHGTSRPSAGR